MRKIVTSIIDAMKSQPLALAVVIINVLFLVFGAWVLNEVGDAVRTHRDAQAMLLAQMTDHCIDIKRELR